MHKRFCASPIRMLAAVTVAFFMFAPSVMAQNTLTEREVCSALEDLRKIQALSESDCRNLPSSDACRASDLAIRLLDTLARKQAATTPATPEGVSAVSLSMAPSEAATAASPRAGLQASASITESTATGVAAASLQCEPCRKLVGAYCVPKYCGACCQAGYHGCGSDCAYCCPNPR